ncbi:Nif3-like dinuclear metal center hexameric protein [candidate division KSB1 bacterium]|nr:Nif3-like dinuclear metal center hexameric protein [candidate division KSB1 bacterium]
MVKCKTLVEFLAQYLSVADFDDGCVNGLQVEGKEEIRKIVAGVSASQRLFQQASRESADLVLVHHGLFWKKQPLLALTGFQKQRLLMLLRDDINLLAYHLPLDAHPQLGNNARILAELKLAQSAAVDVGFIGEYQRSLAFADFITLIREKITPEPMVFHFGAEAVKRVLVISGGSSYSYGIADNFCVDTFICGDMKENFVREIEETGLNVINAGHYNTEKFGIQALCGLIREEFDVSCQFIDIPNPV